jgi:hypothetical protein
MDSDELAHTSNPHISPDHLSVSVPVTTASAPSLNEKPKKVGILKWISGALKSRTSSTEEMEEDLDPTDKGTKRKSSADAGSVRKSSKDQPDSPPNAS